jgi:hypothetical protein
MNYKAMLLLILGLAIIMFPGFIRYYRADELGKKATRDFIFIQRMTGILFVLISIILLALGIN